MNYEFETNLSDDQQPYEVTAFAKKHGLTVPAADAVLFAKGPSRAACDAGALAFLCAVAQYASRRSSH
ncbi:MULTISPECIES: hypothetical protein [Mesorhizobium]|uniref:hypothetical protein n=1 Tax=Mesorhizobium TaxID=68287 RepID=UPI0025C66CFE|nr:hypothetical protein [Mesorhizobium sp.]